MTTKVEWDHTNGVALMLWEETWPEPRPTGTTRRDDARTEWLPVEDNYPPDYLPQYPELLGARTEFSLAPEGGRVIRAYPEADYSPDEVRNAAAGRLVNRAADVLRLTDALVFEALEKGQPVDPEIASLRDDIRAKMERDVDTVNRRPITEVVDFTPADYEPERGRSIEARVARGRGKSPGDQRA